MSAAVAAANGRISHSGPQGSDPVRFHLRHPTPIPGAPEFVQQDGTFNPWRNLCGFYPPDVVARQRDLTDGEKRLYERAIRWACQNGYFWRAYQTIAAALGISVRQVKSDMATLEGVGLISHVRRGNRQSNFYTFLWHPMFESEVQDAV